MNLVMSDITRNKLGCYMAQQASLNNIPVSALVSAIYRGTRGAAAF
ncbi:Major capsid protein precursor (GpN) [Escherichia coli]|uniref:Major capsid protein (GpN) n=1 Tax=Escherichia coli TaxID=562 RepID=A0A376RLT4_ECOLX|nr:Major capsid protein precursor (GpN) [Escherichia coli]